MSEEAGPRQTAGMLALRTVRNKDLLFVSLPVYRILLEHPKWTRMSSKQAFGNSPSLEEEMPFSLLQRRSPEVPM